MKTSAKEALASVLKRIVSPDLTRAAENSKTAKDASLSADRKIEEIAQLLGVDPDQEGQKTDELKEALETIVELQKQNLEETRQNRRDIELIKEIFAQLPSKGHGAA